MSNPMNKNPYVIANWKMNPETKREALSILRGVKNRAAYLHNVNTVLCPPSLFLHPMAGLYGGKKVKFGAQDIFYRRGSGSFTGETSADQLMDADVEYVIVGHSERRDMGETNEVVEKKVHTALKAGFKTVVCVGEKARDENGEYLQFVKRELKTALVDAPEPYRENILIAYEPIWAIGGGPHDAMSSHEMHQMSLYIRKVLREFFSEKRAEQIPILYGGSVERSNAEELIKNAHVQGFLVGHASLDPDHFVDILEIVNEVAK